MIIFDQNEDSGEIEPVKYEFVVALKAPKEDPVVETFCKDSQNASSGQDYFDKELQASCETKSEESFNDGWAYLRTEEIEAVAEQKSAILMRPTV